MVELAIREALTERAASLEAMVRASLKEEAELVVAREAPRQDF